MCGAGIRAGDCGSVGEPQAAREAHATAVKTHAAIISNLFITSPFSWLT